MKNLTRDHVFETLDVRITGRVQGVGFRAAAVRQAHLLGVTGWVRNNADGSVQTLLQGRHDQIDRMLSWLLVGPPGARVDEVDSRHQDTGRRYEHYEQI